LPFLQGSSQRTSQSLERFQKKACHGMASGDFRVTPPCQGDTVLAFAGAAATLTYFTLGRRYIYLYISMSNEATETAKIPRL
jgi:hypothetical protein